MYNIKYLILATIASGCLLWAGESKAQNNEKKPGDKTNSQTVVDSENLQLPATGKTAALDPKLAAQKRGAISSSSPQDGAKTCTPIFRTNPNSISRKDFEKLPADRQRFILENGDKYSIID